MKYRALEGEHKADFWGEVGGVGGEPPAVVELEVGPPVYVPLHLGDKLHFVELIPLD